ncbi:hypothetical protein R1sor_007168 [Riccia sorocarpa]|uniref:Reverse transcriptase domain-containing protein n=1 Tax=Riccia sorocarpa TaxID=122646 RepID=A0ABD3HSJ6_9MARC
MDQEKAYDRLSPDFRWAVLLHLDFPQTFISAARALQENADSRILLNGQLLAPFTVSRGVRQGCPLSPLLYVIASIPVINRFKKENDRRQILPIVLTEGTQVSCVCLADDLAIFTEIHEDSVSRILQVLRLIKLASGGRVNVLKSKIITLGSDAVFPDWLRDLGFQLADRNDVITYLGAPLTTMLVTRFKKSTLKKFDRILREFIWSSNADGKKKRSLCAWDNVAMPVKWGGLGILSAGDFQTALICRVLLKALQNPHNSLWAPIFTKVFLDSDCDNLLDTLVTKDPGVISSACPVASQLHSSWIRLISAFHWTPLETGHHHSTTLKKAFFSRSTEDRWRSGGISTGTH